MKIFGFWAMLTVAEQKSFSWMPSHACKCDFFPRAVAIFSLAFRKRKEQKKKVQVMNVTSIKSKFF